MSQKRDLFDGFPRGITEQGGERRSLEQQAMPQAAFMPVSSARSSRMLAFDASKIFLGVVDGKPHPGARVGHTEVHGGHAIGFGDDTHFMTVAGSRAGKGRSVIVPTLLTYTGPVLASDPKAELTNITAAARAAQGHRVLAVDPFGITRGRARR